MEYEIKYSGVAGQEIKRLADEVKIRDKIPSVTEVRNGVILPRQPREKAIKTGTVPYQGKGGVLDSSGNFQYESAIWDLPDARGGKRMAFGGAYPHANRREDQRVAIYMGLAHQHWGHFLVDVVQRCWYPMLKGLLKNRNVAFEQYQDSIELPENYVFAFSGFGDEKNQFGGNFAEFFRLLGIEKSRIYFVQEPTMFSRVILPDVAVIPGLFVTEVYKSIFNLVVQQALKEKTSLKPVDKIYFSRTHMKSNDIGENAIESVMLSCGFHILYPEELSLVEQIFYWQTTKCIASINGTIPHNVVFSKKEVSLIV